MTDVSPSPVLLASALAALVVACGPPPIQEPATLGGRAVEASTLNAGRQGYAYYCASCHGPDGDGRGRSAEGLMPPPRDFRLSTYKFAGVASGYLPPDEELRRIVRGGLHGTAMLKWRVPDDTLDEILQYVKSFAPEGEGWRDPDAEIGTPPSGSDPWAGREDEARRRGRALYHGMATCNSCHPAYETRAAMNAHRVEFGKSAVDDHRARWWLAESKPSDTYTMPIPGDPACADDRDCDGTDTACRYGRCELKIRILPPDFLVNEVRSGSTPDDLFRTIAVGIPGTAMPAWQGSLPDEDIWAMAHYVSGLVDMKGTPEARRLMQELRRDTGPLDLN